MIILTILIAILVFGFLILVHELGHYIFARIFDVHIHEFSIGMGPKLISKTSKKTGIAYSLRALPIGGYVMMAGEDEETDDPRALNKKPVWQRIIITAAGGVINILIGFILTAVMVLCMPRLGGTTIAEFQENAPSAGYLQAGDTILSVDGHSVTTHMDLAYEIMRLGIDPVDIEVERDGQKMLIEDVVFPVEEMEGSKIGDMDFILYAVRKTPGTVLRQTFAYCRLSVKQVWESLIDLIRGRYSLKSLSGPVGVTSQIGQAAQSSVQQKNISSFLYIIALIAVNLGIVNLLPIPALDGGRIVFMLIELIFRKKVPAEIEAKIHFCGIVVLMALMLIITFKDVFALF